jgi:hypothetical protein
MMNLVRKVHDKFCTAAENLIGLVGESVSWSSDRSKINIKLRLEAEWLLKIYRI